MAHHNICFVDLVRKVVSRLEEPCFAVARSCLDTDKRQGESTNARILASK